MRLNKLKLNSDKSELLVISSKYRPRPSLHALVLHRGPVAQLVEQRFALREVVSSTLAGPTLRVLK